MGDFIDWGNILPNRALIIDNNPINSELLVEVLKQIDVPSKVLYSSENIFDILDDENFDLIFLDVVMPFVNGYQILEKLSENLVFKNIPVIFLSAMSETKDIVKGLELGCYDYITKPYCIEELQAKIKNILKIKRLQEERDYFIETVTHDLKTPVRSEIRAIELLLNGYFGELNQMQADVLREVLSSSNCMFFMLDSILSKYQIDQNKIKLMPVNFNVNDLISECVRELGSLFKVKSQSVNICFESQNDEIFADYIAIKRIIVNLLSNAIKFSHENAIIRVRIFDEGENVKVSVIDSGIGIPSSEIKNIFEHKKETLRKLRQVGSGLGLYVSKKIAAMHGGEIAVKSIKGKGSNFTVVLPRVQKFCESEKKVLYI